MGPRRTLVRYYRWLRRYGLNDSHSGNASIRITDTVWVTPTGACADTLRPRDLIACPLQDQPAPGASLDAPIHLAVYRANPRAGAVLHGHNPHAVALTLQGTDYLPPDFEGQLYFPRVPVLDIPYKRHVADSPQRVAATLAEYPVVVVRGHGAYAWGEDLDRAYKWLCSLELSAQTAFIAHQAGMWGQQR